MSAKDQKFMVAEYPPEDPLSMWLYYYRKTRDDGAEAHYFYDIESLPEGDYCNERNGVTGPFAVRTWHGDPGKHMWRNHNWVFDCAEKAQKKVRELKSKRGSFKGGAFTQHNTTSRLALPEEKEGENAASTKPSLKRGREDK